MSIARPLILFSLQFNVRIEKAARLMLPEPQTYLARRQTENELSEFKSNRGPS